LKDPSELNKAYNEFKSILPEQKLPPPGVSVVLFEDPAADATFSVLQMFTITGLINTILEIRLNFLFKNKFPLTVEIRGMEPGDAKGPFQEMNVRYVNTPDTPEQLTGEQKADLNLKYIEAKKRVKMYLLDNFANQKYQLRDGFYYAFDSEEDALLRFFLNREYLEEGDLRTGWAVVQGDVDFSQNLFTGDNFAPVLQLLEDAVSAADNWHEAMLLEVFGEKFANGWVK
jgi:hypothetical protein